MNSVQTTLSCEARPQNSAVQKVLYSRKEAARYLGVAPQTLAAWTCLGRYDLPYAKIGRRVYYRKSDLDAFAERHVVRRQS